MSDKDEYRLGDAAAVEPLINHWAVWSDRVSPAPASLHLLNYQLKILSSYVANPEIHLKACENRKFMGGPFINIPLDRADEAKQLLEATQIQQSANIKFAMAMTDFYDYLTKEAKGQSLEPFYAKVPDALRGYVELVYDYHNHPIIRFLETFLYDSDYYDQGLNP